MPIVCVNRPNRTKKRTFSEADLKRIARIVHEDQGISAWAVIGTVAVGVGLGSSVCFLVQILRDVDAIRNFVIDAGISTAALLALKVLIGILTGSSRVFGKFNVALAAVAAALVLLGKIVERVERMISRRESILVVIDGVGEACAKVKELGGDTIDLLG